MSRVSITFDGSETTYSVFIAAFNRLVITAMYGVLSRAYSSSI
jgi:hypothetical protein